MTDRYNNTTKRSVTFTVGMLLAAGGLLVTGPEAQAQTQAQSIPTYDLSQTIDLAIKSSNNLAVATTNLDRDAAAVSVADAGFLPSISTTDTYQHLDSPVKVAFAIPGQPPSSIIAQREDKEFLTATASLPIDISGKIRATTDAAKLQLLSDKFQVTKIRNSRILEAQTYYYDLLRAKHQVGVANAEDKNAHAQEAIAQKQFEGGIGQKIDYLRAQTQVANADEDVLAAQNSLIVAQNNFNDLIGAPMNREVTAVDAPGVTTGEVVSSDVNALSTVTAPNDTFYTPSGAALPGLDTGIALAEKMRPELLADQVEIQAANAQVKIARTGNEPSLSLSAVGDYYPETDFGTPRHSLGVYSVTLSWPLYDGGATAGRVREAHDDTINAKSTYGSDQTTVELQVRQAYANLSTSQQKIMSANSALQEAIAARTLAQVRYANGVGLYLEVTDAESALTQADNNQVNAVYDYLTARANYENVIGSPNLDAGAE